MLVAELVTVAPLAGVRLVIVGAVVSPPPPPVVDAVSVYIWAAFWAPVTRTKYCPAARLKPVTVSTPPSPVSAALASTVDAVEFNTASVRSL